ncbi:maleylpyruvate isomerase family mycothiol-dependent enzyme [Paractinoplanes lichenicola]|uniref:Maleylpyruvate isomerase family mycothiol-dependent enzyme n=1 Tax=Paractinoplanes lichenicola TaxID=2802976 RepID=A0ABS1VP89_9ACTN|nr:maleylpyruvate isomerase family mycothiol-dependent enzyme [Actinoplanes lichenicola]MBL7256540.1 maleylpyruvate isomerase family mycothiol-dependent enzyme [Actinoplanes lichenicola]
MGWLAPERYAAELEAESGRLGAAATGPAPGAIVPTCPEWTVRDLVTHVGTGHRYATEVITTGAPVEYRRIEAPSEPDEWTSWLLGGARGLNAAVFERGFGAEVWTWHPRHQTTGFWLRRMVHDLVVHRFDADPSGELAPDLAADGVADFLLTFEAVGTGLTGEGETLRFRATDVPRSWHVTLTTSGITWTEDDQPADVTVTAPVLSLLLALNRRLPAPEAIEGDAGLWERWRAGTRF